MKKAFVMFFAAVLAVVVLTSCGKKTANVVENISEPYTDFYNDDGTIEKKVYYNDDGSTNSEVQYEYDKYGNVSKETKYKSDNSVDFITTYEHKKFGSEYKIVKRMIYKNEKELEFYEDDYKYEKSTAGGTEHYDLISYITYNADGTQKSKSVYTYSEDGNLQALTTYDSDGKVIAENKF